MKQLTEREKEFILENVGSLSKNQIAKKLNVDKRLVVKFIKQHDKELLTEGAPEKMRLKIKIPFFASLTGPQKEWALVLLIFLTAIIVRIIYLIQLDSSYFFFPFKGGYDDYIYHDWALNILKGNWVGDRVLYIYRMPLYVYFLSLVYYVFNK